MTEENQENKKTGIIELLSVLAKKIKDEIFLLAFVFALIIAFILVSGVTISSISAITFIAIYLIAVLSYGFIKAKQTNQQIKKESEYWIRWRIKRPSAFQNPYVLSKETPDLELVHFDIDFFIKNLTKKRLSSRIYVHSPSQAVVFRWDEPNRIWKRKFGILPIRKQFEEALDIWEEQLIDSDNTAEFRFHGWYRPYRAFNDYSARKGIVLTFTINAKSTDSLFSRIYFNSGKKKIEMAFNDKVEYKEGQINNELK